MQFPAETPRVACGVIPVNRVILRWYTCGADGRRVGRAYSHVITKISRMDYQSFLGIGRSRALTLHASVELRYH